MYQVDLNSDLAKASAAIPLEWMKKSFPLFPLQILPADIMHPILS